MDEPAHPDRAAPMARGYQVSVRSGPARPDRDASTPTILRVGRSSSRLGVVDAGENRLETVIVRLADRVELVIVAPRALDCQAQNVVPVAVIMSSRSSARCWSIPSSVWLPTIRAFRPPRNPSPPA